MADLAELRAKVQSELARAVEVVCGRLGEPKKG